jgi:hypothetical protein
MDNMAEQKTIPTGETIESFLNAVPDERKRQDCYTLLEMMRKASGAEPVVWRGGIVGFGKVHYKYASRHEGDTSIIGFAPRKQNLTIYLLSGFDGQEQLLARLGKHKIGVACLYIKRLDDISLPVLEELLHNAVERTRQSSIFRIVS